MSCEQSYTLGTCAARQRAIQVLFVLIKRRARESALSGRAMPTRYFPDDREEVRNLSSPCPRAAHGRRADRAMPDLLLSLPLWGSLITGAVLAPAILLDAAPERERQLDAGEADEDDPQTIANRLIAYNTRREDPAHTGAMSPRTPSHIPDESRPVSPSPSPPSSSDSRRPKRSPLRSFRHALYKSRARLAPVGRMPTDEPLEC